MMAPESSDNACVERLIQCERELMKVFSPANLPTILLVHGGSVSMIAELG